MSKKSLLWLLLAMLGLLIFFCIKTKISDMQVDSVQKVQSMPVVQTTQKEIKVEKTEVSRVKDKNDTVEKESLKTTKTDKNEYEELSKDIDVVKKDLSLKLEKSADEFSISGVLNNKEDFENLAQKYPNLKNNGLSFDKDAQNPELFSLVLNLDEILKRFKSGYIEYHDGTLIVDGIVSSQTDKEVIDSTLNAVKNIKVSSNIVVEEPKPAIEHVGKLSITKQGDTVTISGIFSTEKEIDELVQLLKDKNLDVKKELCVVDSDLKEDRWKVPFVLVLDDFVQFTKGSIQFDKDTFSVIGETQIKGLKEDVEERLQSNKPEGVVLQSDITYKKPIPTKEEIQEKINSILKLKSLRFITATGTLIKESKKTLDEVAQILLQNPNIKVEIAGHTDSDGSAKSNLILSQHRADTVRKYLIKKGINAKNLKAVGYGEGKPLVKNNSERNKQINRRVEFIILGE